MDELDELQRWYEAQCDGDWEHDWRVEMGTLDNPGWRIRVNLAGTPLEDAAFSEVSQLESEREWLRCWIEDRTFHGAGGPAMLRPMLRRFLDWATSASRPSV